MKAKRILPLLAAAALLAGCFKDVSYKTNYVLKPLAQAQTCLLYTSDAADE